MPTTKKALVVALFLILIPQILFGCKARSSGNETGGRKTVRCALETRTITDMAGRTVRIPRNIESFGFPYVGTTLDFVALGVGHQIALTPVALTRDVSLTSLLAQWGYSDIPKALGAFVGDAVNSESVLKAKPQVVFIDRRNTKGIQQVTELGIPVIAVRFLGPRDGFSECVDNVIWLGNIFGETAAQKATGFKSFVDKTLGTLYSRTAGIPASKRPSVLLISYRGGIYQGVSTRIFEEAVTAAGGRSLMDGQISHPINKEDIFVWNPDIIMLGTENQANFDRFKNDDALKHLKALRNGKIYPFRNYLSSTMERILQAVYMATLFHPDRFSKTYLTDQVISFHNTMYGVALSDEALKKYFAGY